MKLEHAMIENPKPQGDEGCKENGHFSTFAGIVLLFLEFNLLLVLPRSNAWSVEQVTVASNFTFFLRNISMSQKDQLHLVSTTTKYPKDITDVHNPTTKTRRKNKKTYYGNKNIVAATQTTAKITPGVQILQM
jgi:hypothetical protein